MIRKTRAFTLIEMIVAIGVMSVLALAAIVGFGAVRSKAAESVTESSLKHIDHAVDLAYAMRTSRTVDIRTDADFSTAAYGWDGTEGEAQIASSTGDWDLVRVDSSNDSWDPLTVYYNLSPTGITGMARTVIEDPDPNGSGEYHLSFLKSSPTMTVTWSAWCDILPSDLTMSPSYGDWPKPECRFEGDFTNGTNPFPVTDIEGEDLSAGQGSVTVALPTFSGVADYVEVALVGYDMQTGGVLTVEQPVAKTADPFSETHVEFTDVVPGVWYEATVEFKIGDEVDNGVALTERVRPWTVPVQPAFESGIHTGCAALDLSAHGGTATCDNVWDTQIVTYNVVAPADNSVDAGYLTGATTSVFYSTLNPADPSFTADDWTATSGVMSSVSANEEYWMTVVASTVDPVTGATLSSPIENWVALTTGEMPATAASSAPSIDTSRTDYNSTYAAKFDWSANGTIAGARYSSSSATGPWTPLSGTSGTISLTGSAGATVNVWVATQSPSASNDYGSIPSNWDTAQASVTFGVPPASMGSYQCSEAISSTPDVTCNFPNVTGATFYESRFRNNGSWSTFVSTGGTSSRTINNVGFNQDFYHDARACNAYGCGAYYRDHERIDGPAASGTTPSISFHGSYNLWGEHDSSPRMRGIWYISGHTGYDVWYRYSRNNCSSWSGWNKIGDTTDTGYWNVDHNTCYQFRIRAWDTKAANGYGGGGTAYTNYHYTNTHYFGGPPAAPGGLSMYQHSFSNTTSWSATTCTTSTWNASSGASYYNFHQAWVVNHNVGTSRSRTHCGLPISDGYNRFYFQVQACNSYGCSGWSSWKYARLAPIMRDIWMNAGSATVNISWHSNRAGSARWHVYYGSSCTDSAWITWRNVTNDGWDQWYAGGYASNAASWYSSYLSMKMVDSSDWNPQKICNSARYVVVW